MKTIRIIGETRSDLGTTATRRLREEGKIPCVLYGGKEHISFAAFAGDFKNLIYTPNTYLVQIEVGGNKYKSILQDIQFHPVNDDVMHLDFLQVFDDKPVSVPIPVKIEGNSPGVRAGGKLLVKNKKLRVKGLIGNMPDNIVINIDNLELGKSVKVSEINANGLELLDAPANAVVSVLTTRATKQAAEEASKK